MLVELSRSSRRHLRCLTVPSLDRVGQYPIAAGSFGDVWKGNARGQSVSIKVVKVYQESEIDALLMVPRFLVHRENTDRSSGLLCRGTDLEPSQPPEPPAVLRHLLSRQLTNTDLPPITMDGVRKPTTVPQARGK